ncbi:MULTISPECIES: response regulator [unclassified Flavobacterium]|jgi:DNA-binding response OmpR family regulator|uniref:response regulator n=1 Tax=unclassified Flavobacterium TaxID=196869 RepID=UPI0025C020C5|nr:MULTISPECIES: response regulator [unclassified Flavobacterium]
MTKILIAEDSPTQAERLKILLEDSNYEVMIAKDGKTALGLLHDFQPDLIISDIQMPGMNGFELCWQVKSNPATRNIPVILLTSLSSKDDVLNGIESGADSFINKPYSPDYLIYYVEQTLIQSQQGNRVYDEVNFETVIDNKKRFFTANPQRMMSLLISTYESARNKNRELVEAQDELQKSEEKYRELFQNAEVGMYLSKLDGSGIVAINPKLCEILGYTEEEIFMMPMQ